MDPDPEGLPIPMWLEQTHSHSIFHFLPVRKFYPLLFRGISVAYCSTIQVGNIYLLGVMAQVWYPTYSGAWGRKIPSSKSVWATEYCKASPGNLESKKFT